MGKLLVISLIISLIGIFAIIFLAVNQTPSEISGNIIANSYIQAEGEIISIKTYSDFSIIQLDTNITVICFKCDFKPGQKISVTGTLDEYQGKKQINAEEIKIKN